MMDFYFNIFIRQIIFTAHEILKLYEIHDLTILDVRRYICGKQVMINSGNSTTLFVPSILQYTAFIP